MVVRAHVRAMLGTGESSFEAIGVELRMVVSGEMFGAFGRLKRNAEAMTLSGAAAWWGASSFINLEKH
jgi:hypothetical protein